jgi:periplasmic copper chaperone A
MRTAVPIMAALLALSGCGGAEPAAPAEPSATVRLPAVPGRPAAGYFELRVEGDRGALVSASSPQAGRVELHETMSSGNMTSMRPIDRIPVRDGETLLFRPGGRHLMLFDLSRDLAAGGRIDLILNFERGAPVTVAATLVPTGGDVGH